MMTTTGGGDGRTCSIGFYIVDCIGEWYFEDGDDREVHPVLGRTLPPRQ